jgi:phospholipid-binding lipoprotein MlaA
MDPTRSEPGGRRSVNRLAGVVLLLAAGVLASCGPAPIPEGINDPLEQQNRAMHEVNKALDRNAVRPVARAYGDVVPGPGRTAIANIGSNVALPSNIVNGLLQADLPSASTNTARFLINTTVGIGGLLDPATAIGVLRDDKDFGETLHRWGVGEGNYVELPVIGPTTERDLAGMLVDVFLNPLRFILPDVEANWATGFQIAAGIGSRDRFSDTIDSVLYESADSYAQTRLLFLQNRRYELGQGGPSGEFIDPYEDAGFIDPYEDPYAE